ncbi:MAG TPA: HAMP domain-containing sensor histidine kinase [Longimicrobiaceae bacterium]|jgi:two-component system sensor histidine kinase PhoQ|nr:HAMP domain-containing sensor histidine kinase [Longimicrobiaceae bacterium]
MTHPPEPDPDVPKPQSGGPLRNEVEELGRVAGELMHDMAAAVEVLESRVRIATGEARMGRLPMAEMDRVGEATAEMAAMLRDVMDVLRGAALSPEVTSDVRDVVERAIRRVLPEFRPVEIRLEVDVPADTQVGGRESFLLRAVTNLVRNAARHARDRVRVTVAQERAPGGARLLIAVEDDGPGMPEDAAQPPKSAREPRSGIGMGLGVTQWTVERLGGTLEMGRSTSLGGARFEIRLPGAAHRVADRDG